jgi:DNA-binding transcriptional LysR family regulator
MPEGLRITAEGKALLDAASAMERSAEDIALRATMTEHELEGSVRIATTEMFATIFLVGILPAIRHHYPHISIELVLSNAQADLLKREADMALRFRPLGVQPMPGALVARKLRDEPLVLYGSESYLDRRGVPEDVNVLADHDVVLYSDHYPASDWCSRAYRGASVALSSPSMQVTTSAIAAGLGLGVIPTRAARSASGLRALSPVIASATAWILLHPDLRRVPRIRVVADIIASFYQNER